MNDFGDMFDGPIGGWEDDIHNPDWDLVREIGLNFKERLESDTLLGSFAVRFSRRKAFEERYGRMPYLCARCGLEETPDDAPLEVREHSGKFGYGPKNNLCWDCWHLPDIEDWLHSNE